MTYGELLELSDSAEYKKRYQVEYCDRYIYTHDGIKVRFYEDVFEHAFYKNKNKREGDKSIFCFDRAKRMLWIKKALMDTKLTIYQGWDSKKKTTSKDRRVCLVSQDGYVVVISMHQRIKKTAKFITAFICDDQDVINKIKSNPIVIYPELIDTVT